jgi:preprotein translocase SecE subunit
LAKKRSKRDWLKPFKWLAGYFRESFRELGKVNWPNRATSLRLTAAVITISVFFAIFMGLVDLGLNELVKRYIVGV